MAASSSTEDTEMAVAMEEIAREHDAGDIESAKHSENWNSTNEDEISIDKCMDPEIYSYTTSKEELQMELLQVSPLGNTLVHFAASVGDAARVERLRYQSPELILTKNNDGNLPLHLAASVGNRSTVLSLVEFPQTDMLREKNNRGNTALHVAMENGHIEVAKLLILIDGSMWYSPNMHNKTPISIAAEAGNHELVNLMLYRYQDQPVGTEPDGSSYYLFKNRWEGNSVLRAAILGRNKGVFDAILLDTDPSLINSSDEEGMTAHTLAAHIGDTEAADKLLSLCPDGPYKQDKNGFTPAHLASRKGHVRIVEMYLNRCPPSRYLLDGNRWNILHVAVWHRRDNMVKYLLKRRELEGLINQKDRFGNTPLHLAVRQGYPKTVSILASDKRVNLSIRNHERHTAMEIARMSLMGEKILFLRRPLTVMALTLADASRSQERIIAKVKPARVNYFKNTKKTGEFHSGATEDADSHRQTVNNLLLVSTLVATVTFAAGFTVPGGYKNSGRDEGMATLVTDWPFKTFLICNTIAMYSSITGAISLLWAQTGDMSYASARFGLPILGVALSMMFMAFMAGVALVTSNLIWLSIFVAITGSIFLVIISALLVPLIVPISSKNRITRFILYCIFRLLLSVTRYDDDDDDDGVHIVS
ncbi:hypothetical protein PRUPE_8G110300 [Prunus persica]|uniref:PGG domain-containing protein n=1 Tax=Prunus persica TaxID=3760 RepID=A0A251MWB2_PRUPE|nr:protein ACCELERATED CELL DEATH 6 [Prunus persica]ONH91370.1 hypothetical protein PRUPE_8G110300 [Prunus persica]